MQLHSLWNVLSVPVELLYITSALWAVTAAISKSRPSSLCASKQASKIQSDSSVMSVLHLSLCRAKSEKCHDSAVYGFSSSYLSLSCSWCVISTMINAFWPKTSTRAPDLHLQVSCETCVQIRDKMHKRRKGLGTLQLLWTCCYRNTIIRYHTWFQ